MRILCLHDQGSNACQLQSQLHRLGERLLEEYGIDLVYINAPLVMDHDHENDNDTADDNGRVYMDGDAPFHDGHDDIHDGDVNGRPRTWWQTSSSSPLPPEPTAVVDQSDAADNENHRFDSSEQEQQQQRQHQEQQQYLGLDASLLLLQQVWKTSCPTSIMGILGVGQGAQVGALLSLMLYSNQYESCLHQQQHQQQEQPPNSFLTGTVAPPTLPPPRFAIWINATSSLLPERERLTHEMECLHLLAAANNHHNESSSSSLLYQQFGGQVIVQEAQDEQAAAPDDIIATTGSTRSQDCHDVSTTTTTSHSQKKRRGFPDPWWTKATYVNHMGRFLLEQKRTLQKLVYSSLQQQQQQSPTSHETMNGSSSEENDNDHNDDADCRVLVLQQALIQTQHEASRVMAREIAANPPAALMAIIEPTCVAVGANASLQRQRPAAGGAPCPSEFLLHRHKRQEQQPSSNNHRHESESAAASADTKDDGKWASREHPPSQTRQGDEKGHECSSNDDDVYMEGS